jgi:hypothetical protein
VPVSFSLGGIALAGVHAEDFVASGVPKLATAGFAVVAEQRYMSKVMRVLGYCRVSTAEQANGANDTAESK